MLNTNTDTPRPFARRYANGLTKGSGFLNNLPSATQRHRTTCTHLTMDRHYGNETCPHCRKTPDMGFLYACSQDESNQVQLNKSSNVITSSSPDWTGLDTIALVDVMRSMGFSLSVMSQAADNQYSPGQLKELIKQRQNAIQTIRGERLRDQRIAMRRANSLLGQNSLAVPHRLDQNLHEPSASNGVAVNTTQDDRRVETPSSLCHFRCCHTCRPALSDRTQMHLAAVVRDDYPPLTSANLRNRPIMNADIVCNYNLETTDERLLRTYDSCGNILLAISPFPSMSSLASTAEPDSTNTSSDIVNADQEDTDEDEISLRRHWEITGSQERQGIPSIRQRYMSRNYAASDYDSSASRSIHTLSPPTTPGTSSPSHSPRINSMRMGGGKNGYKGVAPGDESYDGDDSNDSLSPQASKMPAGSFKNQSANRDAAAGDEGPDGDIDDDDDDDSSDSDSDASGGASLTDGLTMNTLLEDGKRDIPQQF